jgi:hypothetical protein
VWNAASEPLGITTPPIAEHHCNEEVHAMHAHPTEHPRETPAKQQHSVNRQSGNNNDAIYGDPITVKIPQTLRVGFQNFNGLKGERRRPN